MIDSKNTLYVVSGELPVDFLKNYDRSSRPLVDFIYINTTYGIPVVGIEYSKSKSKRLHNITKFALINNFIFAANLLLRQKSIKNYIVSSEDLGIPLAICALLLRRRVNIVCQLHGFLFPAFYFKYLFAFALWYKRIWFGTLSESLRRILIERYGARPDGCFNAAYGTDTIFFDESDSKPEAALISSAGASHRDYATLAEAVKDLPCTVKIVAASLWTSYDASKDIVPANCEIESHSDTVRLRELYRASTIVVVPLTDVDFSTGYTSIGEMLAMGKPAIVTKTGAPPDFLIDGETVLFVRPHDPLDLKQKLETLLNNEELRVKLGKRGASLMRERYTVEAFAEKLVAALPRT
jgi:glycosyltransferase involved in cell wall biosynthesis